MADKLFIGVAFVPWLIVWSRIDRFDTGLFASTLFMTAAYLGQRYARWRFEQAIAEEKERIRSGGYRD